MQTNLSSFCNQCGALVNQQAAICTVCGKSPRTLLPPSSLPAVSSPVAFAPYTPAEPPRPGALFAQRYRILDKLGEGGFGVTYKAEDFDDYRRLVAIKQINLGLLSSQEMIEVTDTFNREVKYLSRLKHHGIPRIHDHFTDPRHWYLVMDYIEGETLEDRLKQARRGRLPAQKVLAIGIALCDVLGYLHSQQPPVIFRDLKPANIMLNTLGRVYLIDFGVARHHSPGQKRDTTPLGSPGYAAPEQYGKAQSTTQTDIYGLGATLQTLLTGKDPLDIAMSSEKQKRKIKRRVPKKLRPLLQQMLEHDASSRPKNMQEVKEHLLRLNARPRMQKARRALVPLRQGMIDALFLTMLIVVILLYTGILTLPLIALLYTLIYIIAALLRLRHAAHQESLMLTK